MSARITLGSTLGGLVLLIIIGVVVITGSKANEESAIQAANDSEAARIQSQKNNEDIQSINQTLHHFIDMWTDRIKIGNNNTNTTQKLIIDTQQNILGNLTGHRIVTNQTFEHIGDVLNATEALTSDSYNKAAEKKVENILGNMTQEHEIIFKALNITKSDNETDAETDIAKLKLAIQALENRTKTE